MYNRIKFYLLVFFIINVSACGSKSDIIEDNMSACVDKEAEVIEDTEDESYFNDYRVIRFGKYEQDGDESNGKEDIEWIVVQDDGVNRLLVSKYVLDAMPYNEFANDNIDDKIVSWENSTLRTWLNDTFFEDAFSDEEKQFIYVNTVKNGVIYGVNNSIEPYDTGNDTYDKVFILSKDEMRKYFGYENEGSSLNYLAKASKVAKDILDKEAKLETLAVWHKEKEYSDIYSDYAEYWLRNGAGVTTHNAYEYFAPIVEKTGHISNYGYPYFVRIIDKDNGLTRSRVYKRGVRPVIMIAGSQFKTTKEVDSEIFETLKFGVYEQDGNNANGKEEIEWLVIDRKDGKALLLSKYILDYIEYSNVIGKQTPWKESSLRAWCNYEFYDGSFDEKDKVYILSTKIINYDNPVYEMLSGENTIDKVFIPSFDELMKAYNISYDDCIKETFYDQKKSFNSALSTTFTDYALKKYRKVKNNNKAYPLADFWLRNQGRCGEEINSKYNNAMYARTTIDFKGTAYDSYKYSNDLNKEIAENYKLGVRLAMWVDYIALKK